MAVRARSGRPGRHCPNEFAYCASQLVSKLSKVENLCYICTALLHARTADRFRHTISMTKATMSAYRPVEGPPLFTLPLELREYIYELSFTSFELLRNKKGMSLFEEMRIDRESEQRKRSVPSNVLRACKSIHKEASPVIHRVLAYRLHCIPFVPSTRVLLRRGTNFSVLQRIRNIQLDMTTKKGALCHPPHTKHLRTLREMPELRRCHVRLQYGSRFRCCFAQEGYVFLLAVYSR